MFTKIYDKLKDILKKSYKTIIFLICFSLILSYPVPYYIFTSGGITDLSKRFEIENGYKQEGSYNLSYVTELNANVLTYLASYLVPSWDLVEQSDYKINDEEDLSELEMRSLLSLAMANQTAVMVAYEKAGKEVVVNDVKHYVIYTEDFLESSEKIYVGDVLIKVEKEKIDNLSDIADKIESKNIGDYITLTFDRNGKEKDINVKIKELNGYKVLGIAFYNIYDYEVTPKITFNFKEGESGASAGFMTSLAIYDTLIEKDLTHGLKIAGTGTIEADGAVGEIGGVSYKLKGAVSQNADIFFVPAGENYEEAKKVKDKKNYKIDLVPISNISDAIEYLDSLEK